jgi:hypothetical protein
VSDILELIISDIKADYYMAYRVVDRDMFMHFTGGGIGHLSTRVSTQIFEDEIQGLWGTAVVEEHTDNDNDSDMDNLDQIPSDPEDTFISEEFEIEEEGWYTDQEESDGVEDALNDLADDGDCIENESILGYEMF